MSICGTTTLKPREIPAAQPNLAQLPGLPRDQGEPVFAEPWEASAFALAVSLSRQGHFSWKEWAAALADELKASSARGEPDDGSHYYHCWLTTLERLVIEKGLSDTAALLAGKEAWAEAYQRTPHGKPVELADAAD
jgi:nitrile hydratase accessory protein